MRYFAGLLFLALIVFVWSVNVYQAVEGVPGILKYVAIVLLPIAFAYLVLERKHWWT